MVYTTPDLSGLGPAIQNVGSALGQVLQHRGLQQQQLQQRQRSGNLIQEAIAQATAEGQPLTAERMAGIWGSLAGAGVDPNLFSPLLEILTPQLKEDAKIKAYENYDQQRSARGLSPLEEVKLSQREKITPQGISVTETEKIQPMGEFERSVEVPTFKGQPITQELIESYERSPFGRDNRTAQRLATDLHEYNKLKGKYNLDTAKENRAAIKEYSKPYLDLTKLKETEKKIQRLAHLINEKKVGRKTDVGTYMQALLEGKGNERLTEIFKTPEEQELGYLLRDFYNTKEIGGSNPSTKEVLLTLGTLVDRFKTPEANKKIAEGLLNHARSMRLKGEAVLKNMDKGMKLGEFISTIENDVQNLNSFIDSTPPDSVPMISPEGELWYIKKSKVNEAKKSRFKNL